MKWIQPSTCIEFSSVSLQDSPGRTWYTKKEGFWIEHEQKSVTICFMEQKDFFYGEMWK